MKRIMILAIIGLVLCFASCIISDKEMKQKDHEIGVKVQQLTPGSHFCLSTKDYEYMIKRFYHQNGMVQFGEKDYYAKGRNNYYYLREVDDSKNHQLKLVISPQKDFITVSLTSEEDMNSLEVGSFRFTKKSETSLNMLVYVESTKPFVYAIMSQMGVNEPLWQQMVFCDSTQASIEIPFNRRIIFYTYSKDQNGHKRLIEDCRLISPENAFGK